MDWHDCASLFQDWGGGGDFFLGHNFDPDPSTTHAHLSTTHPYNHNPTLTIPTNVQFEHAACAHKDNREFGGRCSNCTIVGVVRVGFMVVGVCGT